MPTSTESSLAGAALPTATHGRTIASLDAAAVSGLRELDPQGRNGLVERVVKAFQESLARLAPQLLSAVQSNDFTVIRHVSHTLKSSSASIGALRLSSLCAELEAAVRAGVTEGIAARVEAIRGEIENVKPALEQLARTSR